MYISDAIKYVGVNDRKIDLFEGQFAVPNGMAYNSYVIEDEKCAVLDTVAQGFGDAWLANIDAALDGRQPDYLVVHHVEPDHSANITRFLEKYPHASVVAGEKAFALIRQFYACEPGERARTVKEGDTLTLGRHTLRFFSAPMVHWPEVMVSFDTAEGALFSADAFGKFGALDADGDWECEARRYYFGIVGKYGAPVQALLKKLSGVPVKTICPLHGPVLNKELGKHLALYDTWSSYRAEKSGVTVAYTSVYGHTKAAALQLADGLRRAGEDTEVFDLARDDMAEAVESAFCRDRLVLATTTYNTGIFPPMREFIEHLCERGFQSRTVAFIENGSWAPQAANVMRRLLQECKNLNFCSAAVSIRSACDARAAAELAALQAQLCDGSAANEKQETKKKYVCKVCGYIYEGETLPADFVCPLCGHPAADFELLQ